MTDSQQQSYYELALTNRQVMVAFVVLLVCIFVAFFSGIWVGRRGEPSPSVVASSPTEAAEAAAEDLDLGTLEFFSDNGDNKADKPKKPLESVAKERSSGTTLLEDVTGERSDPSPPAAAEPRGTGGQVSTTPADSASPEPTAPTPQPVAQEAAAAQPTDAAPAAGDLLVIQVFSSSDAVQAGSLKDRLLGAGYSAFISSVDVGGRTMHRVRVGPFTERSEASAVADRMRREFKLDTWITR